jgi:peptidoglycan/xylan/chitin deacetylase (PgdA/CDA1 family)
VSVRALFGRVANRLRPRPARPLILMYHRVAAPRVDPWELAVPPDVFAAQLDVLRTTRVPLPMSRFVARARRGALPARAVAVTFDDGYADTLREARPRLAAAGVPATLFLATAFVGQALEYWWDEIARVILERNEPLDAVVTIDRDVVRLALPSAADAAGESAGWRASEPPRTARERLYFDIWQRLRLLRAPELDASMRSLRAVLGPSDPRAGDLPMDAGEVGRLARDPLFEIGGHTASHPVLPALTPAERRRDIRDGKAACERLIGRSALGFAYPHGANDADSRAAVAECGFDWACTTRAGWVPNVVREPFALPRLAVGNWDAATFARVLEDASA